MNIDLKFAYEIYLILEGFTLRNLILKLNEKVI